MTRGYITLATGRREFIEMAVNLVLSLRKFDPDKEFCLLHDQSIEFLTPQTRALFHHLGDVRECPSKPSIANLNKLLGFEGSPFEETMFIDADCIIVKSDMDRHWEKMSAQDFNIAGEKAIGGSWYDLDIANLCKELGAPYIARMNSGVYYFNRSEKAEAVFKTSIDLFRERKELLAVQRKNYNYDYADEPFFGASMGVNRIDPASYTPEEGSIMITTLHAKNVEFDLASETSRIDKPAGFWIAGRFLAKKWVRHSPTIAHFIKLKPKKVYQALSDQLRDEAGVERFNFSAFS
ncbi:MAG: hypothetical protein AAGA09_08010 [Pseudomonadota bacterium]